MKVVLMGIGRTVNPNVAAAIDEYCGRIRHFIPFEYRMLPDVKTGRNTTPDQQKTTEGKAFLQNIQPNDLVILLDERGRQLSSRAFASQLDRDMAEVSGNIIFLIGGPYGFSPEVYSRANRQLSLSTMVFPHDLIRLFFTEQIYRACTILRNMPYHHD